MRHLNRVTLIGNVGKDPEIRSLGNDKEVASFSVATSSSWQDKSGNWQKNTEWHNIVVFSLAMIKVVKTHLYKGCPVYIEGEIKTREWKDKSGLSKYTTEIVIPNFSGNIIVLESKPKGESDIKVSEKEKEQYRDEADHFGDSFIDDDIPF